MRDEIRARAGLRGLAKTLVVSGLIAALGRAGTAQAAGVEDTATGAMAIGRQASFARANDFMAVWQNPANLALVPRKDLGLEIRLPIHHGCFERERNPNLPPGTYLTTEPDPFPEVCNEGALMPAGNAGFAMPLPKGLGFGVGVFSPGGVPNLKFGDAAINSLAVNAMSESTPPTTGAVESPNRFLLLERNVMLAFLMAGVGYQPNKFVRFGASVGAGYVHIDFKNVNSFQGGTLSDFQVLTEAEVADAFLPRATLSVASTPLDSVDLMASFTWTDDISADGEMEVTANGFSQAPSGDCASPTPGVRCKVKDVTLDIPFQRFEVVLGGRYAYRRNARTERALDPMRDELWDVELNGYWTQTSHVDNYTLHIHDDNPTQRVAFSTSPGAAMPPLPHSATLFHGWRDTFGVRLGGDYNVIAERLALRAGLAWESRGLPERNMSIDYWPVQKTTVSLGATAAFGRFKLAVAYAHSFGKSIEVPVGQGNVREVAALLPELAQPVNEGKFTYSLDVIALQGNYSF